MKKKQCRRIVSLILVLILMLAFPMNAFAGSDIANNDDIPRMVDTELQTVQAIFYPRKVSITISEYDMLCELRQLSEKDLNNMGFGTDDIAVIKGTKGGSVSDGQETYGDVTYTISSSDMYIKGSSTYLATKTTWDWSKEPMVLSTDVIAMTTSENFTKDTASVKINYFLYGNKNSTKTTENGTVQTQSAGKGVFARIIMGKEWDTINKKYKKVALSGEMTTNWSVSGSYTQVGIASKYGHSIITLNPSVSFGSGVSISFSPAISCQSGDEASTKAYVS